MVRFGEDSCQLSLLLILIPFASDLDLLAYVQIKILLHCIQNTNRPSMVLLIDFYSWHSDKAKFHSSEKSY